MPRFGSLRARWRRPLIVLALVSIVSAGLGVASQSFSHKRAEGQIGNPYLLLFPQSLGINVTYTAPSTGTTGGGTTAPSINNTTKPPAGPQGNPVTVCSGSTCATATSADLDAGAALTGGVSISGGTTTVTIAATNGSGSAGKHVTVCLGSTCKQATLNAAGIAMVTFP